MDNFFENDEKSVFDGAEPFWGIRGAFKDLAMSYMPEARDVTVKGIPQASSAVLCRHDDLTDKAYA